MWGPQGMAALRAIKKWQRMSRLAALFDLGIIDNKVICGVLGTTVPITLQ